MAVPKRGVVRLLLFSNFFLYSAVANSSHGSVTYNVVSFGANNIDSSKSFLSAWAKACASVIPVVIYVPAGNFFLGSNVVFSGRNCKNNAITFQIAGTLVAPSDYGVIGNVGNWILFQYVNGVTISGGVLDGQGTSLWACKASAGKSCPSGTTVSAFNYIY